MSTNANSSNLTATQVLRITLIALAVFVFTASLVQKVSGQCVDRPDKKKALKFANESSFDLSFFVDDDETGVIVASKTLSIEHEVKPGEHLLRARAIIRNASFWVWVVNDVPEGQSCTWTIEDPPSKPGQVDYRYRSSFDSMSNGKNIKSSGRKESGLTLRSRSAKRSFIKRSVTLVSIFYSFCRLAVSRSSIA